MNDVSAKNAARAIDALRRGWPVRIGDMTLVAIETGFATDLFAGQKINGILLSSARAATLKLANQFAAADIRINIEFADAGNTEPGQA